MAARLAALGAIAVLTLVGATAGASLKRASVATPTPIAPARGASFQALPAFGWRGVGGIDHYEFQIGADPSFNSPVLGTGRDAFSTRNTWATLKQTVPNGTYWWHVRAVSKSGAVSGWSSPRSIRKQWRSVPKLVAPSMGAEIRFPTTPLVLRWSAVPYAARYLVYLATDRDLGTLVSGDAVETQGLSYSPSVTLADRHLYYWAVVPVDAEGNHGVRSKVSSFTWRWRSETTPSWRDLVAAPEHFDPQLSWKPVPGAARYEVEINPAKEWTIGSKVCCNDPVVTTALSPTDLLPNNRYYYRVRAINVDGNAGRWTPAGDGTTLFSFTKVFDNYEGSGLATVKNVRLLDNLGNALGLGGSTTSPIIAWDPVPGASKYEVVVTGPPPPCPSFDVFTAVPAWTPLATGRKPPPYSVPGARVSEEKLLCVGRYSVNLRAYSDDGIDRKDIFGNFTYVSDAFNIVGYPTGGGALTASAYLTPVNDQVERWTPLFRWQSVGGAVGYWVIVSKDQSFTTIADYAYTRIPAYAPRTTYTDEETSYYWAILPDIGSSTPIDPNFVAGGKFQKRSLQPTVVQPATDRMRILGPPTFRWSPAMGAKYYLLQVSEDRNFGTRLDEIKTHSTAYTSTKTYAANAALYFRVRAVDENEIGLTWSARRVFRDALATPKLGNANERGGDLIPTWTWQHIQGALSYDVHVDLPDGGGRDFSGDLLTALTPTEMSGTGVFRWKVRAEFPEARGGKTAVGPYSRAMTFIRTVRPPKGARASVGGRSLLLSWQPKIGARQYLVQVATTPDFSRTTVSDQTDGTVYAPDFSSGDWSKSKLFYWRVAVVDAGGNSGNYSPVQTFRLQLPEKR